MVKGRDQLQASRQQQAFPEYVASHIADADYGDVVLLHVDAALAEMALHRDPAAFGGDTHAFVVITGRAARGEGVVQPEAVFGGNAVGDIGEGRGALVGRYHQVRIVAIVTHHVLWWHHGAVFQVVGDIQQAADKDAVAGNALGQHIITAAANRQASWDKAALGTHRYDDRVLHLLRLDQAQHLGAEVFLTVRPAQATTSDVAKAQVHAFNTRRVDKDFELRRRPWNIRNRPRIELEAEVRLVLPGRIGLVEVGAQGSFDQVQIAAQDAVFVKYRNVVQRGENRLLELLLLVFQVISGELARQVKTRFEQAHQLLGDIGMVDQGACDVAEVEAQTNLLEVAGVSTKQRHITPRHGGHQHQTVEAVVLRCAANDIDESALQGVVELLDVDIQAFGIGKGEVVNPELAAISAAQFVRELAQYAQAEVFQNRQHIRQRQRRVRVVQLAVQLLLALGQRLVEAHHQLTLSVQAQQVLHVHHRRVRGETFAVTGRETTRELAEHFGALGFAEAFDDQAGVIVLPRTAGLNDFFFQAQRVDLHAVLRVNLEDKLHPRQYRLGEEGPELAIGGLQALHQHLLDLHTGFGGVHIAWHISQAVAETAVRIAAQEYANLVALLNLHDRHGGVEQLVHRGLEQVVTRQHFQYLSQLFAQVRAAVETGTLLNHRHLAANKRNAPYALGIHRRGVQAHKAAFLDDLAFGVQFADRHQIRIRRAVHAARNGGLGKGQQLRLAQVGHGFRFDMQLIGLEAAAQALGQAQQGLLVIDHAAAAR